MTSAVFPELDSAEQFYDRLAEDYDTMVDFHQRLVADRPFISLLVKRYGIKRALDVGCGTGAHAILLAQLGVEVTGVDISEAMLRRAEAHANHFGVKLKLIQSDYQHLGILGDRNYDAVISLGNTFAHLLTDGDRRAAVRTMEALLKPGGVLFMQTRNFDRIVERKDRIQSVKSQEGKVFVRYYDFDDEKIIFNILTLENANGRTQERLTCIPLRPVLSCDLRRLLEEEGFVDVKSFGSISMEPFDSQSSRDHVVLARRHFAESHLTNSSGS